MNNHTIIKAYSEIGTLKGSDILALGADTLIIKQKNAKISINPRNGSEYISFTFNDEIKVKETDNYLFKQSTPIVLSSENMNTVGEIDNASFAVGTTETLVVTDTATPINFSVYTQLREIKDFEIDVVTASVKNISGRALTMCGEIGFQATQTGGQPATLYVATEISDDGSTWTKIPNSLREIYMAKSGIDYITIPSLNITDWEDGQYVRFLFAKSGSGGVTISSPNETLGGDSINGQSFTWTMIERAR